MNQDEIIAQKYHDPKLADIRSMVSKKNDNIPFLLLPVRVETRFMKTNKKTGSTGIYINKIFEELIKIDFNLKVIPEKLAYNEFIIHAEQLEIDIIETFNNLKDVQTISDTELLWLKHQEDNIRKNYKKFSNNVSKVKTQNSLEKSIVDQKNIKLSESIKLITNKVKKISQYEETKYNETIEIISKLDRINNELNSIKEKDFSLSDKTVKVNLYSDIENKISTIYNETKSIRQNYNVNMVGESSQIQRIKEINASIQEKLTEIPASLSNLRSNYKKAEYLARFSDINNNEIKKLQHQLDNFIIPKLEFNLDLKIRDAREIHYEIINILYDIKWINNQSIDTYEKVKKFRVRIYNQLIRLRANVHEVIEATDKEIDAISETWKKVDKELVIFVTTIRKIKGKDRYEKAGISRAITHINQEYRKDLEGLKKSKKGQALKLTNQNFTNSAIAYKQALDKIKNLEKRFTNHLIDNTIEPTSALYYDLISYNSDFKILSRNISVMPQKFFYEIKASFQNINDAYKKINHSSAKTVKNTLISNTDRAFSEINKAIVTQRTDVVDFKDKFYDEFRKQIIYAYKTVTVDELWVRIYPDDIAIHTHEDALTKDEVSAGKAYWNEIWAASDDYDLMLAAWRAIVAGHGSQRAAWIVKKLDPSTVNEKNTIFRNPPSSRIVHINGILEEINTKLTSIDKENNFTEILASIDIHKISNQLADIENSLTLLKQENSFLLIKTNRLLRNVHTKLSMLVKLRVNLTNRELNRLGEEAIIFDNNIQKFNAIIKNIQNVENIITKDIIKNQEEKIKFPSVEIKEESWTVAPHTRVMPDQFVVLTVNKDKFTHIVTGNKIPAELKVGLDPEKFKTDTFSYDKEGDLIVDKDIKWMTDYEAAVIKGMGISIELTGDEVEEGFDKILVLGIKNTSDSTGKKLIEELLNNHHYNDEGMDILSIGTPSNNTHESSSGFLSFDEDQAESFKIERNNENELEENISSYKSDGKRLAEGLGISHEVFNNIRNTNSTEISDAINMNKALWPATLGTFMSDTLDSVFTLDNINRTRNFFTGNVTGRGIISPIRIATQPYGILPTTAFSRYNANSFDNSLPILTKEQFGNPQMIENELQMRFDIRFKEILFRLYSLWKDVMNTYVKHSYNTDIDNPQQHFMDMLGLHATSVENYYRYSLNVVRRRPTPEDADFSINFASTDYFGPDSIYELLGSIMAQGYFYTSDEFRDENFPNEDPEIQYNNQNARIKGQLYRSRLYKSRNISDQAPLTGNLIDSQKLSEVDTIEKLSLDGESKTYIEWLLNKSLWSILNHNDLNAMPSKSLLFLLLRQSLLTEYRNTALDILQFEKCTDEKTRRKIGDSNHYQTYSPFWGNNTYVTKWTYLFNHLEKLNGLLGYKMDNLNNPFYNYMKKRSMATYIINPDTNNTFKNYGNSNQHKPIMQNLDGVKGAINRLNEIPTAKLNQLMAEHLDLCTYRLDAWMLGLVNQRLEKQRAKTPAGIYIGAYGWLENLRKSDTRKEAENIPDGLCKDINTPVYTDKDNQGYIHAPSISHAVTAAILRAGYISNKATTDLKNQFAINLSSERVRMALNILEGVRNGQETGAVLGYQFERGLHERYTHLGIELDKYIYDFREKYPLVTSQDSTISITNATANVVHGLDLLEEAETIINSLTYDKNMSMYEVLKANVKNHWPWLHNLIDTDQEIDAILKEIDRMANAFDALGDLVLSESVYQIVKGNHKRAAVVTTSLSEGKVPPEMHIVDTPRTGIFVTHKVMLHYEPISGIDITINDNPEESTLNQRVINAGAIPANWGDGLTPRAFAEPSLNKWLGELIGNPANIKCKVNYKIDNINFPQDVSLMDLGLQALDFIYIMGAGLSDGGGELNNRIAYHVRSNQNPKLNKDVELEINFTEKDISWDTEVKTFYEIAPYARYLLELISDNNPVTAEDIIVSGEEVEDEENIKMQDVEEFETRVNDAYIRLEKAYANLTDYYANETDIDNLDTISFTEDQLETLRGYLFEFSWFGISSSIPESVAELSDQTGREMVKNSLNIYKIVAERLANAQADINVANASNYPDQKINSLTDAARSIFGKSFAIYPHYSLRNPDEVKDLILMNKNRGIMRNADKFAMDDWMQGISKVRKRMDALQNSSILANAFEMDFPQIQPIQMPFTDNPDASDNDHWTGIEYPQTYSPSEDKLSIVLINPGKVSTDTEKSNAGILIDQWVEIIPDKVETTGVTFNYDQPDAKPPQNLLLAVTPKETGKWNWDDLVYTLSDTLDLAKIRAVESEHLDKTILSQVLPAIMAEVVPPQLKDEEDEESASNPLGVQVVMDFGVNNEDEIEN